jgi:hypothetical protein
VSVTCALAVLALGCAPAFAAHTVQPTSGLEPGVTIDEGSPAAKEYALALTQARHTGSKGVSASSSEAPFGAGITPPASGGKGSGPKGGTRGASGTSSRSGAESGHATPALPAAVLGATRTAASSGNGSVLALLGGGVAILVLGGLGGVVLRHSRRPPSAA